MGRELHVNLSSYKDLVLTGLAWGWCFFTNHHSIWSVKTPTKGKQLGYYG
jgi:hypothetical protein